MNKILKLFNFLKYKLLFLSFLSFLSFLVISLVSYDPYDSSFNTMNQSDVLNLGGKFGAFISSIFLENIGFGSLWFVFFIFVLLIFYFYNKSVNFLILRFFSALLASGFLAILTDLSLGSYRYKFKFMIGGYFGYYISNMIMSSGLYIYISILCVILFVLTAMISSCLDFLILKKESIEVDNFIDTDFNEKMYEDYLKSINVKSKKKVKVKNNKIIHGLAVVLKITSSGVKIIYKFTLILLKIGYFILSLKFLKFFTKSKFKSVDNLDNNSYGDSDNHSVRGAHESKQSLPAIYFLSDLKDYKPDQDLDVKDKKMFFEKQLKLQKVLHEFGVKGKVTSYNAGPVVTLYKFEPRSGTKSSRAIGLASDIARTMEITSTRISNIPKQNALGIEIPNEKIYKVGLRSIICSDDFVSNKYAIPIVLGKDISGENVIVDLAKMPHLLIAGTTGSGKSVGINAMIVSLLYKFTSEECKLILIDPKMLEFAMYNDIPHLLFPVVNEPKRAIITLKWLLNEMERRYKIMAAIGVKNISGYNEKIKNISKSKKKVLKKVKMYNESTNQIEEKTFEITLEKLPFIVLVIDEMADLMLVAGKEIEFCVQRLSQMARASGIHMIMATQRPSVDVITGVIKSNFPIRISYRLTSKIDSRTILGEQGAEQLLGNGDMLYLEPGSKIKRIHGPIVSDHEIQKVVNFLKSNMSPSYVSLDSISSDINKSLMPDSLKNKNKDNEESNLYESAKEIVLTDNKTSISYIQRRLRIGYNKAANLIEKMEEDGFLSPPDNSGKRSVLKKR